MQGKAYITAHNRTEETSGSASTWLTLPDETSAWTAQKILNCYGWLIRRDERWLHALPATLQAEVITLIRCKQSTPHKRWLHESDDNIYSRKYRESLTTVSV